MKFIDNIKIEIEAGKGGDGIIAFLRELYRDNGGPAGGNGGKGGSVYFVGDTNTNTLLYFQNNKKIKAEGGEKGGIKNQTGKSGKDTYIYVPIGTIVYELPSNRVIANVSKNKEKYLICEGGKGGRGNASFKTHNNNAPSLCENGDKGERKDVFLELQLLADVGLIGFPNAGKSTFISKISSATPKVADYPFTTLSPVLGVVDFYGNQMVFADIPGLIEGASEGKGLGIEFLKHINKCSVLLHMIDGFNEPNEVIKNYKIINNELAKYGKKLIAKDQIIIINKKDMLDDKQIEEITNLFKKVKVSKLFFISAINFKKNDELLKLCYDYVEKNRSAVMASIQDEYDEVITLEKKDETFYIEKKKKAWHVTGETIKEIFEKIPMISTQNRLRVNSILKAKGVFKALLEKGVKVGDHIHIYGYEFEWESEN
ncbi:hypothetical protein ASO20_00425 [Mycoplasma sp. (ex Biomphalaria glabrata)]|uniref:GTPase ObgE n=1 Tax=Mycoplasma sp. (ex Biomphalaria glabrata) TaxID=1749074 RepID=UPI00073AAEA8|nr:GTPase ObgE [Mycoplasma sp. (ex Biomphalaria glabrata)]ALV23147.1 hypothetical protein ASO20_00425 [Mycoplasma sp. (ex Biomphalaria glabrata)]